jgi:hypothetical protein
MSNENLTQPRYSPDRLWYWNGHQWLPTPAIARPASTTAGIALVVLGAVLAAVVELFALALPETLRQAQLGSMGGTADLTVAGWLYFGLLLGFAGLANVLVWRGARRWAR